MAFFVPPERYTDFAAGLIALFLAGWLFYLKPGNRLHQAFALFLTLRGVLFVVRSLEGLGTNMNSTRLRLFPYLLIAIPFAAFFFLHAFRNRFGPQTRLGEPVSPRALPSVLLAATGLLITFYVTNRNLFMGSSFGGDGYLLQILDPFEMLAYVALAAILLRDAERTGFAPDHRALRIVSLGLLLEAAHVATHYTMEFHPFQPSQPIYSEPTLVVAWSLWVAAIAGLVALAVTRIARIRGPHSNASHRADRRFLAILALPIATGVGTSLMNYASASQSGGYDLYRIFRGFWAMAFGLLLAYAIVEHHLFDIHLKLKFALRQSSLAGVFVAVFFVVSEGTAEMLGGATNEYVGILAAAMLLFAIHPLQRLAERFADKAMPEVEDTPLYRQVRQKEVYRALYESALREGTVSAEDRKVLGALQNRFGIQPREAHRMELEVLNSLSLEGTEKTDELGEFGTRLGIRLAEEN